MRPDKFAGNVTTDEVDGKEKSAALFESRAE